MRFFNGKPLKIPNWVAYAVFVLAILGYFILYKWIGASFAFQSSRRTAENRLGTMAYIYVYGYLPSGSNSRNLPANPNDSAHTAAYIFAHENQLNDASVYFVNNDPLAPTNFPKTVLLGDPSDPSVKPNPEFAHAILGVVIAANLALDSPPTTTPIAWTRGLQSDGTWSADSPFGVKGGYIAFLDGHREWFDKTQLYKYGTHEPTANIRVALPPGAVILSAEPNLHPSPRHE